MKKLLFFAFALFVSGSAMAQIQFESSSLKEALAKAKAENKLVMAIGSATWCGPCQAMAKSVYPLPEVGEYMNKNFVSMKYELDKADPDKIKETYGLSAYPTYFFLDGDGVEVARMVGGAKDAAGFIERVKTTTTKENQWAARNERFKNDPSYTNDHIQYLASVGKKKEAGDALNEVFAKRTMQENFSKGAMELYKTQISSVSSPILKSLLENKKEGEKIAGKDAYSTFMKELMTMMVFNNGRFNNAETMDAQIAFVKANPITESAMATLLIEGKDAILGKDGLALATTATKLAPKFTSLERDMVAWLVSSTCKDKEAMVSMLNAFIKNEKDSKTIEKLNATLERISK